MSTLPFLILKEMTLTRSCFRICPFCVFVVSCRAFASLCIYLYPGSVRCASDCERLWRSPFQQLPWAFLSRLLTLKSVSALLKLTVKHQRQPHNELFYWSSSESERCGGTAKDCSVHHRGVGICIDSYKKSRNWLERESQGGELCMAYSGIKKQLNRTFKIRWLEASAAAH